MARKFLIYGLIDPRTSELRYVGKSCSGLARPKQKHNAHCGSWEKSLKVDNLRPEILIIEEHERADDLIEAEIFNIAYYRSIGCRLTNMTDGGEGTTGCPGWMKGKKHSLQTLKKISENLKGRVHSKEEKAKRADSLRGKKRSIETRVKMSNARKGMIFSQEHRNAIGRASKKRIFSEETKKKLSDAAHRQWSRKNKGELQSHASS